MSGRTIGPSSDGKIKTGWFFVATDEINVCINANTDCETVMDYQTSIEKRPFWFVEIIKMQHISEQA